MEALKGSAQRVQNMLADMGYSNQVVELPDSTRTAQAAAEAIGCEVAQIAKSIIFRLAESNRALLVVASGVNRVNERHVSAWVGEKLKKADADFVREQTGFVIGGVAPVGHLQEITTFVDKDLFQYETVWAAAGHPKAVFACTPYELVAFTKGQVITVT